ncbi:MAG: TIGR03905 family TSCPD domain-containing protein [Clostridia bacterium]|nr:TIGR03905 family TSCPD domain-containing protein [Clostridia bacterium]
MASFSYRPSRVCSREILFDLEDNIVSNVRFVMGCGGNTQGIGALVEGMHVDEVIKRLENIDCGGRGTSCPDQLAQALKQAKEQN